MAGVRAIAAPIQAPSPSGGHLGCGFTSTMDGKKMETVISEIRGTAREIHQALEKTVNGGVTL